ncbi:5-carboxymethyl-2-hydroxymuconate Delta-isomerase [Marinomonas mediterranea]|jgi:5-carboxymethyl-2-hydroxymuconate isomerase|uniref:5-carboxymethyl-2-hydroxymuconate isomerase n=1 Tax=Marinomonas mediterranea (strain ATCC 700492 / JCM 21426 / NBRC 103028 / MMB-1) TaxID=717774 RepID=F2JVN7_MARM1|nr:5-carboxymethyl-2-hydroxymuconate Delta-isomerase [Marinomonas mediterranea]ADZ90581.1 5-carboxymethyl-2-hydroxymuconate isomerase [Marinomonas mediterranea MMB-1]WCN08628.1 5-carboxymethyl-2-hydroxymuconate isomerase [Marinomonas mediterranea]WCN16756.1 5-carboxymethyl-2-hydroxymuconate isomerase [Marinomonas mediterranea MMB-1]
MPHCIVEYSQNLAQEVPPDEWLEAVKKGCLESELFEESDLKLRAVAYKTYMTGGQEDAFVHVVVKILEGRTQAQRAMLSEQVLHQLTLLAVKHISLTVEVVEMELATYSKRVVLD